MPIANGFFIYIFSARFYIFIDEQKKYSKSLLRTYRNLAKKIYIFYIGNKIHFNLDTILIRFIGHYKAEIFILEISFFVYMVLSGIWLGVGIIMKLKLLGFLKLYTLR